MDINSKEVKKVLKDFESGIINKSNCIVKLFFEYGLDSNNIKNIELLGCFKVSEVIFFFFFTLERLDYIDFEDAIDLEKLANSVKSNEDAVLLKLSFIDFILNIK